MKNFGFAKSFAFVLIALIAFAPAFAAAATNSSQGLGGTLSVSGLQYLPNPAIPGQYVDVYISVQNNRQQANSIQCELRPEYPFSLDANEETRKNIGSLGAGQNFVLKYKVRIDAGAILGDNTLKVACKTSDTDWIEAEMKISIQTQAQSLVIEKIESNPREIEPGSQGTVTLTIHNIASAPVRDVRVKLDLSSESIPLAPIEGATEKNIQTIGGNSQVQVSFTLVSLADAEAKAYKVPVKISFKDYLGNAYTLNDTAGIILNSKPIVDAFVEESKILRDNSGGTAIVKVVNRGLSEAKFLNVKAADGRTVRVVSPKEFYVGNLKSDDFDTIEYTLFVQGAGSNAEFPLTLSYRDANNNQYEQEIKVNFRLYSDAEISQLNLEPKASFNWLPVIAIIVVAAGAYWFFIRKKTRGA